MTVKEIPNGQLDINKIPSASAPWESIERFALTFNGNSSYDAKEGPGACAELASSRQANTLTELRASLFFEQRGWRHSGNEPTGLELIYVRSLLWRIRQCVRERLLD
jgi:hypothetical protein